MPSPFPSWLKVKGCKVKPEGFPTSTVFQRMAESKKKEKKKISDLLALLAFLFLNPLAYIKIELIY